MRSGSEARAHEASALTGIRADGAINKVHQHDLRLTHAGRPGVQSYANPAWHGAANAGTGQITSANAQNEYGALFSL